MQRSPSPSTSSRMRRCHSQKSFAQISQYRQEMIMISTTILPCLHAFSSLLFHMTPRHTLPCRGIHVSHHLTARRVIFRQATTCRGSASTQCCRYPMAAMHATYRARTTRSNQVRDSSICHSVNKVSRSVATARPVSVRRPPPPKHLPGDAKHEEEEHTHGDEKFVVPPRPALHHDTAATHDHSDHVCSDKFLFLFSPFTHINRMDFSMTALLKRQSTPKCAHRCRRSPQHRALIMHTRMKSPNLNLSPSLSQQCMPSHRNPMTLKRCLNQSPNRTSPQEARLQKKS